MYYHSYFYINIGGFSNDTTIKIIPTNIIKKSTKQISRRYFVFFSGGGGNKGHL